MRRREVIPGLLSAAAWPSVARAQPQPSKRASIGYLGAQTAAAEHRWITAFTTRLTELGWRAGENLAVEYRWGEGRDEPYAAIAAEFVRLKVDVIVTHGTRAALAAKQTTSTIPIVFTTAGDPVGTGLVESLARPSGNVTGLSSQMGDTAAKRLAGC